MMFSESPTWDTNQTYNSKSLRVYYENRRRGCLTRVKRSSTLLEALKSDGYFEYFCIFSKIYEKNYFFKGLLFKLAHQVL